jgi:hypothetical protein
MIKLTDYSAYWKDMVSRVSALKQAILVTDESHLKDYLTKNPQYPLLVATIPSAGSISRDADSYTEKNNALIFVITKVAASDRTAASYLSSMTELQTVISAVKNLMLADFATCENTMHEFMQRLDVGSFNQDPEYNYLGHDGWSLSFKFDTLGV